MAALEGRPKQGRACAPSPAMEWLLQHVPQQGAKGKHAREDVKNLRELYSQQLAAYDSKCQRTLQQKEQERKEWYAGKVEEMHRLRAGVSIMRCLFQSKQDKTRVQMQQDKEHFEQQIHELHGDMAQLKNEHKVILQKAAAELAEQQRQHSARMEEVNRDRNELRDRLVGLEAKLAEKGREVDRFKDQISRQESEIKELTKRMEKAQQANEMHARMNRIAELEAELDRLRKTQNERMQRQESMLTKEIMDYVRYIVEALPDDWQRQHHLQLGRPLFGKAKTLLGAGWRDWQQQARAQSAPANHESVSPSPSPSPISPSPIPSCSFGLGNPSPGASPQSEQSPRQSVTRRSQLGFASAPARPWESPEASLPQIVSARRKQPKRASSALR